MKIFLKYTLVLATALIITISCRDEDKVRFPDFQSGVNARVVVHADTKVLNFLDIDNAKMTFDIYSENSDIKEITYTVTYTDASFATQKYPTVTIKKVAASAFSGGKASDLTLTSAELAEALGLPGGNQYLAGGDSFTFFASVELTDGRIINAANSAPNIASGTNASFTSTWKLFVSCPFDADEALGTYSIVTDGFGSTADADDGSNIELVKGPGANQVTFKNIFGFPKEYDMIVDMDAATGSATVAKQVTWNYDYWDPGPGYGDGSTAGTGFFFSCTGFITVNLTYTVAAGSFGAFKLELQKDPS